jgi:hypothetical protein
MWGMVAAAIASVAVVVALQAQEHRMAATSSAPSAPAAGTVIFSFSDDEAMRAFETQWQQRQTLMARMAVLQSYWKQEQANLAQVNEHLLATYHLDASNTYTLDRDRRVLLEHPQPPTEAVPPTPTP